MSEELYRHLVDAFNRRDWNNFIAQSADTIEADSRLAQMEDAYRGHEGLRRWWDDLLGAMPDYTLEISDVREMGAFTLAKAIANLASATPLIDVIWQPAEWRNGKCVWWAVCLTEEEALEAIAARS